MSSRPLIVPALALLLAASAGTARAADPGPSSVDRSGQMAPAGEGLRPGTTAPVFMLPVINDFVPPRPAVGLGSKTPKWGPARWTGASPDERKKLVIMSFFATYCEPCKKELPELVRLYDSYKDQGLGVMLVSIDKGDEQRATVQKLAQDSKATFPVMHDRFQMVARRYSAERLPYMLLLDSNGTVRTVHIGYTEELKASLENDIRAQLGLPPLPPPQPVQAAKDGGKDDGKDGKDGKSPQTQKIQKAPPKAKKSKAPVTEG